MDAESLSCLPFDGAEAGAGLLKQILEHTATPGFRKNRAVGSHIHIHIFGLAEGPVVLVGVVFGRKQFNIDLIHHIPRFQQASGQVLAFQKLLHLVFRYGVAVDPHNLSPDITNLIPFFVLGPDLGAHSFAQVPLAGIVDVGDEHGPPGRTFVVTDHAKDGLEGLEGFIVGLGVYDRPLHRAGEDAVTVLHGNEGHRLTAGDVVSAVHEHGAHHAPVGKGHVCRSAGRENDSAVIDLV